MDFETQLFNAAASINQEFPNSKIFVTSFGVQPDGSGRLGIVEVDEPHPIVELVECASLKNLVLHSTWIVPSAN